MPDRDFGEITEQLRRSTVHISSGRAQRGSGSGVIWNPDGLIVTNAHVVQTDQSQVQLWDGREYEGTVTARDARRDLASLRISASGLPAASAGDSNALRPGELVVAIGNPLGFIGALTTGVVHALGPLRGLGKQPWVQASVRLAPGNSGGPLADAKGRVVGLNTMIVAGGLALAVPSSAVPEFLRRGPSRPMLGVSLRPVLLEDRKSIALLVLEVAPHSSAAAASILIGDLLLGANGRPFLSLDDLVDAIDAADKSIFTLEFLRGDRKTRRQVTVRLGARSAEAA